MGVRSKSKKLKQIKTNIRNQTLAESEEANISRQDRISQLPDHILEKIIFYLQQIELELDSDYHNSDLNFVLSSKACYQVWLLSSYQLFSCMLHYNNFNYDVEKCVRHCVDQSLKRIMSHQGLGITSFSLYTQLPKPVRLCKWFQKLDVLKLKIIQLDFINRKCGMSMSFFSYITTLQEISLQNCILESDQEDNQEIRLPSLLRLRMKDVNAEINTIESIIRGSPSLNQLEILYFRLVPDIYDGFNALHIHAPCLTKFSYKWEGTFEPCLGLASCSDLRELSLTGKYVVNDKTLRQYLIQLPNLECLSITNYRMSCYLWISSLSITEFYLHLNGCNNWLFMRIDCPNLHEFYLHLNGLIYLYEDKNRLFKEMKSFLSNAKINITRLKVEIIFINTDSIDEKHGLNIKVMTNPHFVVPWPQLTKLKHLKLELRSCLDFPSEILHAFLWICHPDLITCTLYEQTNETLKMLLPSLRKVAQKKGVRFKCGCVDGNVSDKCWHHSLSDVKMEWCGITQSCHPEVDFQPIGLAGFYQLAAMSMDDSKSFNVRVSFKLLWQ